VRFGSGELGAIPVPGGSANARSRSLCQRSLGALIEGRSAIDYAKILIEIIAGKFIMSIVTVDATGRVQFPEAIRQEFGLMNSAQLSLVVRNGEIVLVPLATAVPLETAIDEPNVYYKGHVLVVESSLDEKIDINQFIEDLREERIQEQMGL
jgi:bifunctional DNA-binding transcriptional regulator/antitoxin component of YhaV-PrlF toxin-antitoxin module